MILVSEEERINNMKPTNHPRGNATRSTSKSQNNFPFGPRRVAIEFLSSSDWTIEVGAPWPTAQPRRNQPALQANSCALGFAPIELVIDAANKKRARRQADGRLQLWVGYVMN